MFGLRALLRSPAVGGGGGGGTLSSGMLGGLHSPRRFLEMPPPRAEEMMVEEVDGVPCGEAKEG